MDSHIQQIFALTKRTNHKTKSKNKKQKQKTKTKMYTKRKYPIYVRPSIFVSSLLLKLTRNLPESQLSAQNEYDKNINTLYTIYEFYVFLYHKFPATLLTFAHNYLTYKLRAASNVHFFYYFFAQFNL